MKTIKWTFLIILGILIGTVASWLAMAIVAGIMVLSGHGHDPAPSWIASAVWGGWSCLVICSVMIITRRAGLWK